MPVTITVTLHTEYLAGGWRIVFTTPDGEQSVSTHCWPTQELADAALDRQMPDYLSRLNQGATVKRAWLVIREERSFTCPRCKMTSYNPNDIKEQYCGNCHAFAKDL